MFRNCITLRFVFVVIDDLHSSKISINSFLNLSICEPERFHKIPRPSHLYNPTSFWFSNTVFILLNIERSVKSQTSAPCKHLKVISKFSSHFHLTHGDFLECIMIFKSLSAIGIISFANLRALLNRSNYVDR